MDNCGDLMLAHSPGNAAAALLSTCAWSASSVATGFLQFPLSQPPLQPAPPFNPMPITIPNYNCKTDRFSSECDRHDFGS